MCKPSNIILIKHRLKPTDSTQIWVKQNLFLPPYFYNSKMDPRLGMSLPLSSETTPTTDWCRGEFIYLPWEEFLGSQPSPGTYRKSGFNNSGSTFSQYLCMKCCIWFSLCQKLSLEECRRSPIDEVPWDQERVNCPHIPKKLKYKPPEFR